MKRTFGRISAQTRIAATVFALGAILVAAGCGGSDDTGPMGPETDPGTDTPTGVENSFFSADVNGRTFYWTYGNLEGLASGVLYDGNLYIDCNLYDRTVPFEDEAIGFGLFDGFAGAGTYTVGNGTNFGQYLRNGGDLVRRADSGYFTIEPYKPDDETIAGTFEFVFTLPDQGELRVSNGKYRVLKAFGD